ncbi:hypothetical protein O3P69_017645 [Scylla paramamosain]|uniref:Amino acid transporter n=1 Tax=Scylla paramamosain TaxID=85552 RepID=A0AAW0TYD7_SCYPA
MNDTEEQLQEVTSEEEEGREKRSISTDVKRNTEIDDKPSKHVTPVTDNDLVTPGDGTTPNPPPRQKTRSKASIETKEEADTHGGGSHGERKPRTGENQNCKSEETAQTIQVNIPGIDMRNRGKKTDADKGEMKPTEDKNVRELKASDVEKSESAVGLKQELGLVNCVGIIVGNIIGTGIFVSPRAVVQYTGSVGMSLIVWMISGVMSIVGALCYAELGTMIPQSGGNYTYLHEAYGPMPAFILIWMTVTIAIPGSRAVAALTFANYVSALRIIGILLILLLTYINARRVRWATKVQDILALTKVLALIMIIMVGFFHLFRGTTDNFKDPMEGTSTSPTMVATAFYHTLYAYEGWDSLNSIMEELKDPFRNMPRAIAISVTIVIIIYMLTNVAYFAVLPKDLLLSSPAVAVTFGNLALGDDGVDGSNLRGVLLFVGSRRGHLPRALSFVHVDNNTPVISLFFSAVLSMLMFVTSDVRVLINYLSFSGNLLALLCLSTFFWFRVKQPNLARPIKVWIGFPIIFSILSFFLCVMPVIRNPLEVAAALAVIVTGLPVYYFFVRNEVKPQRLVTAMDKVTYVCQLFFKAVPEERAS